MRLLAVLFAALAVMVWWHPLDPIAQSAALALAAVLALAFRSAENRGNYLAGVLAETSADLKKIHANEEELAAKLGRLNEVHRTEG